jgi:hypothetical protein
MEGCAKLVCQATPTFFDVFMFRAVWKSFQQRLKKNNQADFFLNCHKVNIPIGLLLNFKNLFSEINQSLSHFLSWNLLSTPRSIKTKIMNKLNPAVFFFSKAPP